MPKKKKTSPSLPPNMVSLCVYGIWSKEAKKVIFVSLNFEDAEMEFDIEGYPENTHAIVQMVTVYDVSSLGSLAQ